MSNDSTATPAGPRLHNGAYTIAHPKHGHFTVKLYTAGPNSSLAGKRIVALLQGLNNETDWQGVAFWDDEVLTARIWTKFKSVLRDAIESPIDGYHWGDRWSRVEQKLAIWLDLALRAYRFTETGLELLPKTAAAGALFGTSYWLGEGYELQLEGRCVVCNRKLTHPESIRLGIGPECGNRT